MAKPSFVDMALSRMSDSFNATYRLQVWCGTIRVTCHVLPLHGPGMMDAGLAFLMHNQELGGFNELLRYFICLPS